MSDFKAMNEVYGQFYQEDPPARAAFAVKGFAIGRFNRN